LYFWKSRSSCFWEYDSRIVKNENCLPCLYYGLEACFLIQSQLRSLELFAVNNAFRKTFSIKLYDVVSDCVKYFNCSVSNSIYKYKRKTNFLAKLKCINRLVYVVSQQQKAASLHNDIQFGAIGSSFWSATRLGPCFSFTLPTMLQLVKRHHLTPHAYALCRRHPDLRSLSAVWRWQSYTAGVCLHWRGFGVYDRWRQTGCS